MNTSNLKLRFPVCSAKPNGRFVNHERNVVFNSKLFVKDYSRFDETDFFKQFYKKMKMAINNMKAVIKKYLGYNASFYKTSEKSIEAAYFAVIEKKSFIEVENKLYNLC